MILCPLSLSNMENTEWSTTELPLWKRAIQASTLKVWREKSHVIPELEEQQAGMFPLGTCYAKKLFHQWNVIQNSTTFIQLLNFSLRAVYQVIFVSFVCSFVRSSLFIHSSFIHSLTLIYSFVYRPITSENKTKYTWYKPLQLLLKWIRFINM